jgi:hypothetical protein
VTRKLILLNLALVALLAFLYVRFRQVSASVAEREQRILGQKVAPQKYPPVPVLPVVGPVVGANYLDVAQRMVMARDRTPNVIIDPEPVKEKPVMPPLPVVQGLMMLTDPGIIMTEKPGAGQKTYHPGEKVGAFKLVAFDSNRVVLDWNGEMVERKLEDLLEKTAAPTPGSSTGPVSGGAAPGPAVSSTVNPPAVAPQGPGVDIGGGYRGCAQNDSTPSGTIRDGLRKVEITTPFGKSCRWEPAK